jgi:predicted nucleic acid-binding Zn ribbon protein
MPQSTPEHSPESVRTLHMVPSCPICGVPLQGRQTVCSAKCRIARSRQKYEAISRDRDAKARLLLRTVIESATEALAVLKPP